MPYRLVLTLDDRPQRHPLPPGTTVLGSAASCDLRISHYTVSRRHARLVVGDGTTTIEDLGSSNGSWVAGRPANGPTPVEPGQELRLGGVRGLLEEVGEGELEAAVAFRSARPAPPPEARNDPEPPTTFAVGSLQAFTLARLPRVLERILDGAGTVSVAQEVGVALFDVLPCRAVEILGSRHGGGILFRAARNDAADEPPNAASFEVQALVGAPVVRAVFTHPARIRGFAPLVESAARLVALADGERFPRSSTGRGAPTPRGSTPSDPTPPPPEPASLNEAVQALYDEASTIARGDVSVLICGASGTGKEVLARFIHRASPRRERAFVALNCAALPRDLLEAELFGVEDRAATGVAERPGKFELAHGGTLFLDEIGDMDSATQAKILRVLQEREVFRIGASAPRATDARVLSATNQDIDALLEAGTLRGDLYHRIADWRVTLPDLADRPEDVGNLAAWFLERETVRRRIRTSGISRTALDLLLAYPWPGNVRELEREIARAALFLEDGALLESRHLSERIRGARPGPGPGKTLRDRLREAERTEIRRALNACGGDTREAAERLGLGRSTLYRKIQELGLE